MTKYRITFASDMARRKKTITDVLITGIADKGKAVGRSPDGLVCFVDGPVPGDIVDVLILRKKKSFGHGIVKAYKKYSEQRAIPFCQHFSECGGCKWQHLDYKAQLHYKQQTVTDAMTKIGGLNTEIIAPIKGAEKIKYYRNKLEYSFSDKRWITAEEVASGITFDREPALGFHRPGAWDKIVDIETCYLQESLSDRIRNHIRSFCFEYELSFYNPREHTGLMRNLIVRNTVSGQWMIIIAFSEDKKEIRDQMLDDLLETFPEISSLHYVINKKKNDTLLDQDIICYHGNPYITEQLGELKYKISPKSFFQTNTDQAKVLYDTVVDFAGLKGNENVYDLYTGLGSIALYVAGDCKTVVGIEEVEQAILDARENANLNSITNATFYAGDVKDILDDHFIEKHKSPDVVITDPPRAGMHADVVSTLLTLEAPKIVYVSCNPATQARDLALLSEKYETIKMQPVDMFPHTHHIENVALLRLNTL